MIKTLLPILLVAGCGSGKPAARPVEPAPAQPAATEEAPAKPAHAEAAPAPPAPAPPAPAAPQPTQTIHDRLRDFDGPVPGLPGFANKRAPSTSTCGGIKTTITRAKTVAPDDKPLAAVYAVEFPAGLTFDPANKKAAESSLKRFNEFVSTLTKTGSDAATFYAAKIKDSDPATKAAAIARVSQVQFQVAAVLARAEIPKDVASGELKDEKVAAYCDKMIEVVEPVVVRAETALETCRAAVAQLKVKGWWNDACGSK